MVEGIVGVDEENEFFAVEVWVELGAHEGVGEELSPEEFFEEGVGGAQEKGNLGVRGGRSYNDEEWRGVVLVLQ